MIAVTYDRQSLSSLAHNYYNLSNINNIGYVLNFRDFLTYTLVFSKQNQIGYRKTETILLCDKVIVPGSCCFLQGIKPSTAN